MKTHYSLAIALALALIPAGLAVAGDNVATGGAINSSIRVNCNTIKKSYNFMEVYRANKAAHPEWSEKELQLATERVLSMLIAAMDICDGKTRLHMVRSGISPQ